MDLLSLRSLPEATEQVAELLRKLAARNMGRLFLTLGIVAGAAVVSPPLADDFRFGVDFDNRGVLSVASFHFHSSSSTSKSQTPNYVDFERNRLAEQAREADLKRQQDEERKKNQAEIERLNRELREAEQVADAVRVRKIRAALRELRSREDVALDRDMDLKGQIVQELPGFESSRIQAVEDHRSLLQRLATSINKIVVHSNGAAVAETMISHDILRPRVLRILGGDGALMNLEYLEELAIRKGIRIGIYATAHDPVPMLPTGWSLRQKVEHLLEPSSFDLAQESGIESRSFAYQVLGFGRPAWRHLRVQLLTTPWSPLDVVRNHAYTTYYGIINGRRLMEKPL